MSGLAIAFMVAVGGFLWGGFLLLALRAVRSEARKGSASGEPSGGERGGS